MVGVFLAIKIVPVRIDGYQFREVLREEARFAAVNRNDKAVVQRILDSAESMNIPLEKGDLNIRRTKVEVIISATYEKPVLIVEGDLYTAGDAPRALLREPRRRRGCALAIDGREAIV